MDFENVQVPVGAGKLLSSISGVTSDNKGGLLAYSESYTQAIHIKPAALSSHYISYDANKNKQYILNKRAQLLLKDKYAKGIVRDNDTIIVSSGVFCRVAFSGRKC